MKSRKDLLRTFFISRVPSVIGVSLTLATGCVVSRQPIVVSCRGIHMEHCFATHSTVSPYLYGEGTDATELLPPHTEAFNNANTTTMHPEADHYALLSQLFNASTTSATEFRRRPLPSWHAACTTHFTCLQLTTRSIS